MTEPERLMLTKLLLMMYERPGATERDRARRNMLTSILADVHREAQGLPCLLTPPVTPETAEAP